MAKLVENFHLSSGNSYQLIQINKLSIPNYHILAYPLSQGQPNAMELAELLKNGVNHAKDLALRLTGDRDAYTLIYSGYSARRRKGWHVHIVILGTRWRKARLYAVLSIKNILQALGLRKDDAPKINGQSF